jgi:hypothetical protein
LSQSNASGAGSLLNSGGGAADGGGSSFANLQAQLNMNNSSANSLAAAAGGNASMASLLGNASGISSVSGANRAAGSVSTPSGLSAVSAANLASLLRQESHTGLSALRMKDGLTQRNTSVDDFLSLMAAGDIPHQDASLLNVPLMQQQRQNQQGQENTAQQLLAQQLLQAGNAGSLSSATLSNLLASRSVGSFVQQQQLAGSKRSLEDLGGGGFDEQGNPKRSG